MAQSKNVLTVPGPDWGVASSQPLSLAAIAYLRLSKLPKGKIDVQHETRGVRLKLHAGRIRLFQDSTPRFDTKSKQVTKFDDIIAEFRRLGANLEYDLSKEQQAQAYMWQSFILNKLEPALASLTWLNSANFQQSTRHAHNKFYSFPDVLISCRLLKWQAHARYSHLDEAQTLYEATAALSALNRQLGENKTLLGTPDYTVVDALLYAYVSIITHASWQQNNLRVALESMDNLSRFEADITSSVFGDVQRQYQREQRTLAQSRTSSQLNWRHFTVKDPLAIVPVAYRKLVTSVSLAVGVVAVFSLVKNQIPSRFVMLVD